MIKAEIIAIGTELLTGGDTSENGLFLSRELARLGCLVQWKSIVSDDPKDIEMALVQAASRASVIVTTGGLGSTEEGVTRKAVSRVTGRRLILHEKLLGQLEHRFAQRPKPLPISVSRQALIPARAHVLPNSLGTAPGFALHWGECYLLCLPGAPQEMRLMFSDCARPYLERLKHRAVIQIRVLRTTGLAESEIVERLKDLFRPPKADRGPITFSLVACLTGVDLHLRGMGRTESEILRVLSPWMETVRERLGEAIYGLDDETLEAVVGRLLVERGLRLAVAESCTGGLIGHRLTNVPGSSVYLDSVSVCYSNSSKTKVLGVPLRLLSEHGAVSAPVAAAMALGVRERSRTDLGLAVTGIAGPTGATPDKPVGLVFFALSSVSGVQAHFTQFRGDREAIKEQAAQSALDLLRRYLLAVR